MRAIVNGQVISRGRLWPDYAVIFDQQVRAVCPVHQLDLWSPVQLLDAQGCYVAPGFIDMHIHGCGGADAMDGSVAALQTMSRALVAFGVTAFVPTTMTAAADDIQRALAAVRAAQRVAGDGARILGAHLEGPFVNERFKGAQAALHLCQPRWQLIADYLDVIRVITLAPELSGSRSFLQRLQPYPTIVPAIGHSAATLEQAQQAFAAGVRHAAHLFNAMAPLHHRAPGPAGAVLTDGHVSAELIADNRHVHPALYSLIWKVLGPERLVLVSDAMRAAGLGDGRYEFGGQMVTVTAGKASLADGTLAGSVLTLDQAVVNFRRAVGCSWPQAIALVTENPARVLGWEQSLGDLAVGKVADIVLLDAAGSVQQTIVAGNTVYQR